MNTALSFWRRVDELRGDRTLFDISEELSIPYSTIRNQRAQNRYPKRNEIERIANALGVTSDFLITGYSPASITPEMDYVRRNKRAEWIIEKCIESDRMLAVLYSFVETLDREGFLQ